MNRYHIFSLLLFIVGAIFVIAGVLGGDIEGGVFLVFPFLVGSGPYALVGLLCIFFGSILLFFGFLSSSQVSFDIPFEDKQNKHKMDKSIKGGGVVLIGPIPIVFGSHWKITVVLMLITLALVLVLLLLGFF